MNALLAIWLSLHSCDAITTHLALSRGGIERNPFYTQSPITNDALMAGEAVAAGLLIKTFAPRHPKLAKTLALAGIGISGYAVMHNARTLQVQGSR
jgi:hypothetical protein